MKIKLFFQAITKFILGAVLVGLLIFIPAGTISFSYGWLFNVIKFASYSRLSDVPIAGIFMCRNVKNITKTG